MGSPVGCCSERGREQPAKKSKSSLSALPSALFSSPYFSRSQYHRLDRLLLMGTPTWMYGNVEVWDVLYAVVFEITGCFLLEGMQRKRRCGAALSSYGASKSSFSEGSMLGTGCKSRAKGEKARNGCPFQRTPAIPIPDESVFVEQPLTLSICSSTRLNFSWKHDRRRETHPSPAVTGTGIPKTWTLTAHSERPPGCNHRHSQIYQHPPGLFTRQTVLDSDAEMSGTQLSYQ
ncbi:hypothetical protein QBC35DRAFT_471531 [Podospora australis]|uniref:Uncharacterized protein n=1 Tax=Podospora australis TaxID=1536484 RepID=A0AAN6WZS2_9PEZI|nr:hypothetical protein QBC35DRAFT_471531 [Podospora australis]